MQQEIRLNMTVANLNKDEYGSFYQTYIDICGSYELVEGLTINLDKTKQLFESVPLVKQEFRYAEGKWTIKEMLQHIIDSERILAYRALRFSRNDSTELSGYEHNEYVPESNANKRDYNELITEFNSVRQSTILLFKSFNEDMLVRTGFANKNAMSVRAIGFIITGHSNHHCQVIRERYLL